MTIKEYLERNDKIREIANNIGIDMEQYYIDLSVSASNFNFVLRDDCYETVKPCVRDGRQIVITRVQICFYEPCMWDYCDFEKWGLYLKSKGKEYRFKEKKK